jgi:hypothetical protein
MNAMEQRIREMSDRCFAEHKITQVLAQDIYRSWICGRQDSGTYAFVITTIPGHLIFTGDLSTFVVTRAYDMLPWCRGAVDDTDYFLQKLDHNTFKVKQGKNYNPQLYWFRDAVRWFVQRNNDPEITA